MTAATGTQPGPRNREGPSHGTAVLEVVGAAILFGTTGTARAKGPMGIDPVVAGLFRLAIGGPLLVTLRLRSLRRNAASTTIANSLRNFPRVATLLGAVCVATYQLGFFAGLARTGVSVGTVVAIGSGPVLAGLISLAFLRQSPGNRWLVATALAIAGAALMSASGAGGSTEAIGLVLVLLAGLGYAGFTMLTRSLVVRNVDGPLLLGVLFTVGAVLVLPFCVRRSFAWLSQPRGWAVVVWLGIGPTAIAYTLFADALRTLSGPTATTFVLAEPVTAILLGRFVLHERLTLSQWVGAAVILLALIVLASESPTIADGRKVSARPEGAAVGRTHRLTAARPTPPPDETRPKDRVERSDRRLKSHSEE